MKHCVIIIFAFVGHYVRHGVIGSDIPVTALCLTTIVIPSQPRGENKEVSLKVSSIYFKCKASANKNAIGVFVI